MSLLTRTVVRALDRTGSRMVLGKLATAYFRSRTASDVAVLHDGEFWAHRTNGWYFPDDASFRYHARSFVRWPEQPNTEIHNAQNWWYKLYRPRPGDTIVDIGAGRGEDAISFSQAVGKTGRVIAIEAHPTSFRMLKRFCAANHLLNVEPLHVAATDKAGTLRIADSSSGEWEANTMVSGEAGTEVEGRTLDAICEDLAVGRIAFLKMNIEGAERLALQGMSKTLPSIDVLCICCHDFRAERGDGEEFRTREFVQDWLDSNGFDLRETSHSYDFERDHLHAVRRDGKGGR